MDIVEDTKEEQTEEKATTPVEIIPGLDFEQVKVAINSGKSGSKIGDDDPILLLVPIFNAYLTEMEKTSLKHRQGLSKALAESTDQYIKTVKASLDGLSKEIAGSSIKSIQDENQANRVYLEKFRAEMTLLARVACIASGVTLVVFITAALKQIGYLSFLGL